MKKIIKIGILIVIIIIALMFPTKSNADNDVIVMLDPGHGGTDSGATNSGYAEKDIVWKIATKVKEILDNTSGITAHLSRTENEKLDLKKIGNIAASYNSDFLVSFHINSTVTDTQTTASGAEVYITGNTNKKRYHEYSEKFGYDILRELRNAGVRTNVYKPILKFSTDGELYADGFLSDWMAVIRYPMKQDIPGILIEHCYINNPNDRANYLNDAMINKMAEADARAIIANKELFRREYKGEINTDLIKLGTLVTEKGTYITGEMYIAEWVEGDCRKPTEKPTLTLKSTDNTVSIPLYVEYKDGIRYYFDKNIDAINIDMNKEYYIEAKLEGTKNIAESIKKKQNVRIPNQIIKENYNGRTIKIINNKIIFSEGEYRGDIETKLDEIKLVQNSLGETYIAGYVGIEEKINGTSRVPIAVPEIRIKSTDGTVDEKTYIEYKGGNKYYFDKNIERYDTSKEYYVEATLKGEENTSTNKTERVNISEGEVGTFNGKKVIVENGNILITYEGTVNTDLINMQIIQNGKGENYISGEIYIAEWINGECLNPSTKPKIILKSTDGTYEEKGYLEYRGGIKYYYDKNIEKIDLSKEYYLEIELTNPNNKAPKEAQRQKANIRQRGEVGKWTNGNKVTIEEGNIIKVEDVNTYYGTVNTDLINMQIIQNGKGENYISGEIYIAEWINGECLNPSTKPKIILKSTDGTYEEKGYLEYRGGIKYYYDKNIEKIDLSKEYYLEIELTNPNNKAPKEAQRQKANIRQRGEVGKWTNGNKVTIEEGNIIKVEGINTNYGETNTDLINMQIIQNEKEENNITEETDEEINNNEVILNNQETEEEIDKDTKEDKEIKKKTNEETELKEEDKTINIDEEYSN